MYAASAGQLALIQQLLVSGASVNAQSASGWTALSRAALKGHPAIVEALLRAGADHALDNAGEGQPLLHHASTSGCPDTLALIQQHARAVAAPAAKRSHCAAGRTAHGSTPELAAVHIPSASSTSEGDHNSR